MWIEIANVNETLALVNVILRARMWIEMRDTHVAHEGVVVILRARMWIEILLPLRT